MQLEADDEATRAKIDSGVFYSSQAAACLAVAMEMETDDPLTALGWFFYFLFQFPNDLFAHSVFVNHLLQYPLRNLWRRRDDVAR